PGDVEDAQIERRAEERVDRRVEFRKSTGRRYRTTARLVVSGEWNADRSVSRTRHQGTTQPHGPLRPGRRQCVRAVLQSSPRSTECFAGGTAHNQCGAALLPAGNGKRTWR